MHMAVHVDQHIGRNFDLLIFLTAFVTLIKSRHGVLIFTPAYLLTLLTYSYCHVFFISWLWERDYVQFDSICWTTLWMVMIFSINRIFMVIISNKGDCLLIFITQTSAGSTIPFNILVLIDVYNTLVLFAVGTVTDVPQG